VGRHGCAPMRNPGRAGNEASSEPHEDACLLICNNKRETK